MSFDCREFTSRCPVTGQPDFATLRIAYAPKRLLIETKSLKLFLWSFRERAAFNEGLVVEIADRIFQQVSPEWVCVEGTFAARGGISVSAVAKRQTALGR